jgi:hypothetical protein
MHTHLVRSLVLAIIAFVACGGARPRTIEFQLDGMGRTGGAL